jgi:outer membrane biosynthesis protein TonB
MKTKGSATLLLALALAGSPALAQGSAAGSQVESLKVLHSDVPVFPQELVQSGLREGEVRVAFSVDPKGRVDDALAIEYTHPEFARVS